MHFAEIVHTVLMNSVE